MARAERPLDEGDGPLLRLASDLRGLREKAGAPTYRELSARAHFSIGALSDAAGGRRLPSLAVTLAYVAACYGDVAEWERRWHAVSAELAADRAPAENPDDPPYLGLAAFDVEDGPRFFGRDRLVAELVAAAAAHRFVAVLGPSGSGKSSVLRAGLLPARAPDAPTAVLTPGSRPLRALAAGLAEAEPSGHVDALHLAALRAVADRPADEDLLVVVDQFEEVFTLCHDAEERERFLAVLFAATRVADSRTRVVIGVRADFYAHCARHPDLAEVLRSAQVLVGPMTADELREAITRPAVLAGCQVESALVSRVVADATGEPGVLPLVSHALLETWRRRRGVLLTAVGYEAVGGVDQAVARTAEAVFAELTGAQRERARRLFLRLVALGEGTEDTKRRPDRAELDLGDPDAEAVVERLAAARLVTLDRDSVQLGHEALIRRWQRLRDWLAEDREQLRRHRLLTDAAGLWESLARDPGVLYRGTRLALARELDPEVLSTRERAFLDAAEAVEVAERRVDRRRSRRLRLLVAVLVLLLAATTATTVYAVRARSEITAQRNAALAKSVAAEAVGLRGADPVLAARLALAAHRLSPSPETRDGLVSALAVTLSGYADSVTGTAFTPDGTMVVTVSRDGVVTVWDVATHRRVGSVRDGGRLVAVAVSPDGRTLATAGFDRTVRLWSIADPRHPVGTAVLTGHTDAVFSVSFSPDGRTVATGSYDHTVRLWAVDDPRELATLTGHSLNVKPVAFSPDGRLLASGGDDLAVRLWDVADPSHPAEVAVLTGHTGYVVALAFAPDGRTLASGGDDRTVRLWDVAGGVERAVLRGHTDVVSALGFSPDGRTLASGSYDHAVRLWDADRAVGTAILTGHASAVGSVAFSRDGLLASASEDRTAELWNTDAGWAEGQACAPRGPAITREQWAAHLPDVPYQDPC